MNPASTVQNPEPETRNPRSRTLLIIYPHWHPANLAGVHRPRLTGNYLKDFGWNPRVITVHEKFYEEIPDKDFSRTFSNDFMVSRVNAFRITRPRIIGDIGLRAFYQIRKKALEIIRNEEIDFIWIPIPSFYMALMGRILYRKTAIPYGIDYIDPWVRSLTNQRNLRSMISQWIARILEPVALRKAALISGVSEAYYLPSIERNNLLYRHRLPPVSHIAFPYGFDPNDHSISLEDIKSPWGETKKQIWLYAGAFLPNSHLYIQKLLHAFSDLGSETENIELYFIGTGNYIAKSISAYAKEYGLEKKVTEIRERFPYLHVLNFLSRADTVMVIGSTEKHYTASKIYQSLLSGKPIFSILHKDSHAVQVIENCNASSFLVRYNESMSDPELKDEIMQTIQNRLRNREWNPDLECLEPFSAKNGAGKLAQTIEDTLKKYSN